MRKLVILSAAALLAACGEKEAVEVQPAGEPAAETPVVMHTADALAGKALFVEKGCVICHSVNGTGGKAAPALDAEIGGDGVDPLDFAARMWRGAPAMIELQSIELGYTIYLTADDIANLAAFSADRDVQKTLTPESLPDNIRSGLLDERFWEMENWDDFLRSGQEDAPVDESAPEDADEDTQ